MQFRKLFRGASLVVVFAVCGIHSAAAAIINTTIGSVTSFGTEHNDVVDGAQVAWYDAYQNSSVSVDGGAISWLTLRDSSTASISGGDISWLQVYDNSVVQLTGVDDLSWLVFRGAASRAEIYADNVQYSGGHLSGQWGNGTSFSFWAVMDNFSIGNVMPTNIVIRSAVPEPGSMWLMVLGLGFIAFAVSKKSLAQKANLQTAARIA
jgi:hypothetical protein